MHGEAIQTFIRSAGAGLEQVRRNLLLVAQTGELSDSAKSNEVLTRIHAGASEHGFKSVADLCADCERILNTLEASPASLEKTAFDALDCITRIEAALFEIALDDGAEIDTLVDLRSEEHTSELQSP